MAKIAPFHSVKEIEKPPAERVHHDDSQCQAGRDVSPNEKRAGYGGYPLCKNCDALDK